MNKILSEIKYPKLLLLLLTFVLAYILFSGRNFAPFHNLLISLGYLGTFLAGVFYAYGFTAAPATAILLILAKEQNILVAGITAGVGALVGDIIIFKIIRSSLTEELGKLSNKKIILKISNKLPNSWKKYLTPVFAGIIIASPLPDEIGIAMLATFRKISPRVFSIISYVLNTVGIFIILIIGRNL